MAQTTNPKRRTADKKDVLAACSRGRDGSLVELVKTADSRTAFVSGKDGSWRTVEKVQSGHQTLRPVPASNSLIRHRVVLLPSAVAEYGAEDELFAQVRDFIHRYVAVTPRFERIATAYVFLSWVFDQFKEVPYLRVRGDYGSGKTRFLQTVGSLCRTPIFASGASTTAPLFHALDLYRGTLVLDEADFRFSDEKAELVKILNNGNVAGMPVLRCEASPSGVFNPRAFEVFGPKIVASRGHYDDKALESRFLTEDTGSVPLREEIPINLPDEHADEAERLRNKLLCYRFRRLGDQQISDADMLSDLEPRFRQIITPLVSVCPDEATRADLLAAAEDLSAELKHDRGMTIEADVLSVVQELDHASAKPSISLKAITSAFKTRFDGEYDERITVRMIGSVLRKKLQLRPEKRHGIYVLPLVERARLDRLYERFGIKDPEPGVRVEMVDLGDKGDIERGPIAF